ncbi:MAG TPA: LysR family transcriptional regulator [Gammaproteobacteria bacterium]|nr:LysR family transcriptional regulator [Gammaproteobacteria bacterium]
MNLLRVFDAMFAERNVTRTARRVYLSQPAVSHALARLRKEIGDPLFVRAGNEMIATKKALSLAPGIRSILGQLGELLSDAAFDPKTSAAVFRIGISDLSEYILAPLFVRLMGGEAPHLRFHINSFSALDYEAQLASGALDVVVSVYQSAGPGIHSRSTGTEKLVALVRNGHPFTGKHPSPLQFKRARLLAVARSDRIEGQLQRSLQEAGIAGQVAYSTPHLFAVPMILENTDLLLIQSAGVAKALCAEYPLSVVRIPLRLPPIEPQVTWHERTHRDPAQRWMRERIMEAIRR